MKKTFLLLAIFAVLLSCHPKEAMEAGVPPPTVMPDDTVNFTPPKNIILMVADGMGLTAISAGMYLNGNKLNLEEFEYIGLQKTYASDNIVTDDAAALTAIACGKKTYNEAIGVDKKGKQLKSILEEAKEKGLATGFVVKSSITQPLPACFFSHQKNKGMVAQIASDLVKSDIDFFVGGGKQDFDKRLDAQNLINELKEKGYAISTYLDGGFTNVKIDAAKKFGYFTAEGEPSVTGDTQDYLVPACSLGMGYLTKKQEKGFFLLVGSSQIAKGGLLHDSKLITNEMIAFDQAIGAVLNFAKNDGQTLIIVTADCETGGYAINPTSTMDTIVAAFTADGNTAQMIPVFAWGPGEELFGGVYENVSIYDKMRRAFGFKNTVQ